MGLVIKIIIVILFNFIFSVHLTIAAWTGPQLVLRGYWGNSNGEFGIKDSDSGQTFPEIETVLPDGKLIIHDIVNKKKMVFGANGILIKEVYPELIVKPSGSRYYQYNEYTMGYIEYVKKDGNYIVSDYGEDFELVTSLGQLIKKYSTRPEELGKITNESVSGEYKYIIEFVDPSDPLKRKKIEIKPELELESIKRDVNNDWYGIGIGDGENENKTVFKFDVNGNYIDKLQIPDTQYIKTPINEGVPHPLGYELKLVEEYGDPMITTNGDVYTWKRTDENFDIIKWIWQN